MDTLINRVIARAGFALLGSLSLWKFSQYWSVKSVSNIGEDQKKSHHLSAGPLALCHIMVNPALVKALRSEKD